MNEWQLYKAKCEECTRYDAARGVCIRNPRRTEKCVCPQFSLTAEAEAARYVAAKMHAQKIGMTYDATGIILRGKSESVRRMIAEKLKGV